MQIHRMGIRLDLIKSWGARVVALHVPRFGSRSVSPESILLHHVSEKFDVFAFEILLEVFSGGGTPFSFIAEDNKAVYRSARGIKWSRLIECP